MGALSSGETRASLEESWSNFRPLFQTGCRSARFALNADGFTSKESRLVCDVLKLSRITCCPMGECDSPRILTSSELRIAPNGAVQSLLVEARGLPPRSRSITTPSSTTRCSTSGRIAPACSSPSSAQASRTKASTASPATSLQTNTGSSASPTRVA